MQQSYDFGMDKIRQSKPLRWYIKEWRVAAGLTQEQLAERMDTTKSQISKLESGKQRANDRWVAGVAEALGRDPADLLRHPNAPTSDDLLRGLSDDKRTTAIRIIEAFIKTG